MASLLRQIVASPRARHPEAGLDLCYVTDNIIATSGPSQTYPQLAYRNPLDQLVKFLDAQHGDGWAIWEFRAEGTGYPDEAVYNRIRHYPWPDHHPPPFRLVPLIMASMRNWLHGGDLEGGRVTADGKPTTAAPPNDENKAAATSPTTATNGGKDDKSKRVAVVHCKAGKGRSGTASCSYLIAEEGWKAEDALMRFTERRMRRGFGAGVSIPSQLRWVRYVDRWTQGGKRYVERPIEILEVHIWGLRSGVKVDVEGFADEGKRIETVHTFKKAERVVVDASQPEESSIGDLIWEMAGYSVDKGKERAPEEADLAEAANPDGEGKAGEKESEQKTAQIRSKAKSIKRKGTGLLQRMNSTSTNKSNGTSKTSASTPTISTPTTETPSSETPLPKVDTGSTSDSEQEQGGMAVILKPSKPIHVAGSDVSISVERRNRTHRSMGLTLVTAVAHVWFNAYFEGNGPERGEEGPADNGVFGIEWEAMDGIKGSSRKGSRAMDRMAVVWRVAGSEAPAGTEVAAAVAAAAATAGTKTQTQTQMGTVKEAETDTGEVVVVAPPLDDDQPVPQVRAADWKGDNKEDRGAERDLGLRKQTPASADVSRASSLKSADESLSTKKDDADAASLQGVKSSGPLGEDLGADKKDKKVETNGKAKQ